MNTRSNRNRRGVTLLFVISMIVLFLLMGTTFIIVSNDFLRAARQRSRLTVNTIESVGEKRGQRFMEEALHQLLRGPDLDDVNSPLRGHSILADMYGYGMVSFVKSIEDSLTEPADNGFSTMNDGDQFVRLELIGINGNYYATDNTLDVNDFDTNDPDLVVGNDILSGNPIKYSDVGNAPGRFNGQILSFVSGDVAGVSCRIIDHQVFVEPNGTGSTSRHKFVIMPLDLPIEIENGRLENYVNALDQNPNTLPTRVVINGRAFAGTGAGLFDPTMVDAGDEYALGPDGFNPNQKGKTREQLYAFGTSAGYLGRLSASGRPFPNPYATNECYDAPDVQNMFLAGLDEMGMIVPSFWRENLIDLSSGSIFDFSFRPERVENSRDVALSTCRSTFPNYVSNYKQRPLDVDNDGDGVNDGVWIDVDLPVFTDELGRKIKPLVSYTVLDLDSLPNINAHGNLSQIPSNQRFASSASNGFLSPNNVTPYGAGFGPAEIDLGLYLGRFLGGAAPGQEAAKRLMIGAPNPGGASGTSTSPFLPGRYGGFEVDSDTDLRRGLGPVPGEEYVDASNLGQDRFSAYKLFGYPNFGTDPDNLSVIGGHYFSPMDIYGRFRTGYPVNPFDPSLPFQTSMPVIDVYRSTLDYSELINNPYESEFSPPKTSISTYDSHFTLEELEGVYRRQDREFRQQENRILQLANLVNFQPGDPQYLAGRFITTDSWEVPTLAQEFLGGNNGQFENLMTKLYNVLATPGPNDNFGVVETDPVDKHDLIMRNITGFFHDQSNPDGSFGLDGGKRALLSNDLRSGRPFDINRPFGNGIDDDGDGIVDEPGENNLLGHPDPDINSLGFDYDQDSFIENNSGSARQLFARQLYILTLLVTELVDRNGNGSVIDNGDFREVVDSLGTTLNGQAARLEYRKMVAQWAINVADFRDPDSIMSPFEVDLNPFDGWDVDGDLGTIEAPGTMLPAEYFVVWGTERPELLITETINGHDRRTEDLMDNDPGGDGETTSNGDLDFDNRLVPQGFSFFELYHPWAFSANTNNDFPNQVLPSEFDVNRSGVDLALKANENADGAPIWRVVVANNLGLNNRSIFGDGTNGFSFYRDPDVLNPGTPNRANLTNNMIRRFVYFTDTSGGSGPEFDGNKVYAPPAGALQNTVVGPGGYVVAGSRGIRDGNRFTTHLGRRTDAVEGDEAMLMLDETRRIVMDIGAQTVNVFTGGNTGNPQSAVVFPLESVTPYSDFLGTAYNRTFSVSDPVDGYANPTNDIDVVQITDGFKFVKPSDGTDLIIDEPVDLDAHNIPNDVQQYANFCLTKDQYTNGAFVFLLQRLANPLLDYDPITNPYLTIDSKGSDVLCFNGVNSSNDPNNTNPDTVLHLQTFERRGNKAVDDHGQAADPMGLRSRILWKTDYSGLNPQGTPIAAPDGLHHLNLDLVHSIGQMNSSYITPDGSSPPATEFPFSWLTWNNRPFNSALELANVPFTSSFFLTNRFDSSLKEAAVMGGYGNLYANLSVPGAMSGQNDDLRVATYSGEFPHLLNFHADQTGNGTQEAFQLHRLFDYVEVPSRYVGTETYINPERFVSGAANINGARSSLAMSFAAPFDFVSNYRVPGKININTVPRVEIWDALMIQGPDVASPVTFDIWRDSIGEEWENPYRHAHSRNYVAQPVSGGMPVQDNQADVGLFRRNPGTNDPLFDFSPMASDPFRTADRNAYYRNNVRQRMGNMVTMRSSVFAIWISVGYFEIQSDDAMDQNNNPVRLNFLDDEVKDVNGLATRNRGFYIFDRSIPVAFEPGRNHNVEKAIRVSSYIE